MSEQKFYRIINLRSSKSAPNTSSTSDKSSQASTRSSLSVLDLRSIESERALPAMQMQSFPIMPYMNKETDSNFDITRLNERFVESLNHKINIKELLYLNVRGKNLNEVDLKFLKICKNLIGVDAGENKLKLEDFRICHELKELLLPLNKITDIAFSPGDFAKLDCLDLSCNNLTSSAIYCLGHLNALRILNLTCNNIEQLPNGLNTTCFPRLEIFILDNNLIAHPNNIKILSRLQNLEYLSLEHNKLWCLPFVESKGSGQSVNRLMKLFGLEELIPNEAIMKIKPKSFDKKTTLNVLRKSMKFSKFMGTPMSKTIILKQMGIYLRDEKNEKLPFLNLKQLNLKDNSIEEESCLFAVKTWKQLKELVILGNKVSLLRSARLAPFKKYIVPNLDFRYCQLSCRVDDPAVDPFHKLGLVKKFFPADYRDDTFCFCHKLLRTNSQKDKHKAFNLDILTNTVPGMKSMPLSSQRLCQSIRPKIRNKNRTENFVQISEGATTSLSLSEICLSTLECVAPSTLPSTVQAVKIAMAKVLSSYSSEESEKSQKSDETTLFIKWLTLELMHKLKQGRREV